MVTYTFLSPTSSDLSYKVIVQNDSIKEENVTPVTANRATFTVKAWSTTAGGSYNADNLDTTVPIYYTTDGSDPTTSFTRRLVRDRKITVYAGNGTAMSGTVKVAITGATSSTTPAKMRAKQRRVTENPTTYTPNDYSEIDSAYYDITYSTSEAGYLNYLNNSNSNSLLYGGDGHVVVYARYTGSTENILPCVFAYANTAQSDGTMKAELLTPFPAYTFTTADTVTIGGKTWYKIDLEPTSGFQEVNFKAGVYVTSADNPSYAVILAPIIIAHADKDVFFEIADNDSTKSSAPYRITDVTRQYTGNFFYTVNATTGVTIKARVNPNSSENFIYVEVPEEWVTDGNSLKVYNGETELSPTIDVQGSAETAAATKLCKVTFTTAPTDGDSLTFKPYNGTTTSTRFSFAAAYHNGGYYRYIPPYTATETSEDGTETTNTYNDSGCYLIFSPYTDDETTDQRPTGKIDINHTSIGNPYDKTYLLNSEWTSSSAAAKTRASESTTVTTTAITDNWNGAASTNVYAIASGTTYTQTASGLTASTPYTVQMIVRGESGATGTMTLTGTDSKTATGSFSGYTSTGTITKDGRVDSLYTDITNGWHKLEATATSSSTGTLTISLAATSGPLQLSDVTLLENANTAGHVWTSAPTSSSVTEFDLSSRSNANAYSFFDRGVNHNAIIYADANSVVGRSDSTYNVVPTTTTSTTSGSTTTTTVSYGAMNKLALTDNNGSWTSIHSFGITHACTAKSFSFDRKFIKTSNNDRSTFIFPFAMSADLISSLFGSDAKIYSISSMTENSEGVGSVNGTAVTETSANTPYLLELSAAKDGISTSSSISLVSATSPLSSTFDDNGDEYVGVYAYTNITTADDNTYRYYGYDAEYGGYFSWFSEEGADFKPFRAYLKHKYTKGTPAKQYYLFRVVDTPSAIAPVTIDTYLTESAPVYNLQGMYVGKGSDVRSLPSGIYIQNGRKFVKK